MKKVLVTGANGFVGKILVNQLIEADWNVTRLVRRALPGDSRSQTIMMDIGPKTDFSSVLENIDFIIHLAARVHRMHETEADSLKRFQAVNVEGTLNLAWQAAQAGVKRFIFLSSVKVHGEMTSPGLPFKESDPPAPEDAYAKSKYEAEQGLMELAGKTGMEVVIIRPPLVYGPGVKGNFLVLLNWIRKGVPLPLGAINNQRSLVGIDNLVDFIITCMEHTAAANQVFLISDGEDLSTTELLERAGRAMGRPVRLIPVPPAILRIVAAMLGKKDMAQRLLGSLQVDISKAKNMLDWKPVASVDQGLKRCVVDH